MRRKFENKTAKPATGRWVRKALFGGAALGLAMTLGVPSAIAGNGNDDFATVTPYNRIARLPVVKDANDQVDHVATYAKVKAAALALANYVALYKDVDVLGDNIIKGDDWVLGGTSADLPQDPDLHGRRNQEGHHRDPHAAADQPLRRRPIFRPASVTEANTKKASVLDFCNEVFAKMALGVSPIVGDKKVVNGYSHTPALPCEVSIWNDDEHIYVDMLDPNAIFSLFFTDVLFSADMADPAFAEAISDLPPQVKSEIRAVVLHAMNEFDAKTKTVDKALGSKFLNMDQVIDVVANSPYQSPYLHIGYTKADGSAFTATDSTAVTQAIINTMSINGTPTAGTHPTVIDGVTLDSILSPGSSWRSATRHPDDAARQQPRDRGLLAQVRQDGHGHRRAPRDRAALRDHRADHRQGQERHPRKRWWSATSTRTS